MPAPFADNKAGRGRCQTDGWLCPDRHCGVDSAFIEAKPPTPIGVIVASVPPQIIMSAAPRSII